MIIRRKHTANFTTIGNALLRDLRLEADELGVLVYLLSQPNDWEVRRTHLAKRFRLGRDSVRRIMRSAIRFGWVVARVTRLGNGTVSVVYEVRDEPGPELTDDEARAALSLVSSGAAPGESSESDGPEDGTEDRPAEGDPPETAYGQPPTGQPGAAGRLLESPPGASKSLLKTESEKTDPHSGARGFWEVQALWPKDHITSPFACEKLHAELTEAMQDAAFNGARPYLDDCRAQTRKVCDLGTYYRERRWERFQQIRRNAQITTIKSVGPNYERWHEYRERIGDTENLRVMDLMKKLGRDITVPSPWPPPLPPKQESSAA